MKVKITNQVRYLLICPLNSGVNIHLGPGETSAPLDHLEINGNEKIAKLAGNGSIAIAGVERDSGPPPAPELAQRGQQRPGEAERDSGSPPASEGRPPEEKEA